MLRKASTDRGAKQSQRARGHPRARLAGGTGDRSGAGGKRAEFGGHYRPVVARCPSCRTARGLDDPVTLRCWPLVLTQVSAAHLIGAVSLFVATVTAGLAFYAQIKQTQRALAAPPTSVPLDVWRSSRSWQVTCVWLHALGLATLFALESVQQNAYAPLGALFSWQLYVLFLPYLELGEQKTHVARDLLRVLVTATACLQCVGYALLTLTRLMRSDHTELPHCAQGSVLDKQQLSFAIAQGCILICVCTPALAILGVLQVCEQLGVAKRQPRSIRIQ